MLCKIFISYRRDDSAPWAGRLFERLARDIDKRHIFMDVDSIAIGQDFTRILDEQVAVADVLLCIIGRNWIDARNVQGQRRLDDPLDFVRIEIASALRRGIRVIPILVDGAAMPEASRLPADIQALSKRNAFRLSHEKFAADGQTLVSLLLSDAISASPTVAQRASHTPIYRFPFFLALLASACWIGLALAYRQDSIYLPTLVFGALMFTILAHNAWLKDYSGNSISQHGNERGDSDRSARFASRIFWGTISLAGFLLGCILVYAGFSKPEGIQEIVIGVIALLVTLKGTLTAAHRIYLALVR
jgi:hypothetical protein